MTRSALLLSALLLAGCSDKPSPPPAPAAAPAPAPRADDDEVLARAKAQPGQPTAPAETSKNGRAPEQLFKAVGCVNCHGAGAAFHQRILDARGKPASELAKWIRHPEQVKPTTSMPSFANLVTEEEALALANWIRAGNPK